MHSWTVTSTWLSFSAADVVDVTPSASPPAAGDTVASRGRTTIADKVLELLATRAALDIPGVLRHSAGPELLSAVTASWPQATADSAGERVNVTLSLALDWDASARDVAARVRDHVRQRLVEQTAKSVDRVDITVAALVPSKKQDAGRERTVR